MFDQITGRPLTATLIVGAGIASAVFNVYGASQVFSGPAAWIFAIAILCMEGIAIVALTHIVTDWNNNNYLKAGIGSLIFAGIVVGCAMSGKVAFQNLTIDVRETNKAELARAERMQKVADDIFARAEKPGLSIDQQKRFSQSAELQQSRVDALRIEVEKNRPPADWLIFLFLGIFELVKSTGRFALAVESKKQWTFRQRRMHNLREKAKEKELRDNVVAINAA